MLTLQSRVQNGRRDLNFIRKLPIWLTVLAVGGLHVCWEFGSNRPRGKYLKKWRTDMLMLKWQSPKWPPWPQFYSDTPHFLNCASCWWVTCLLKIWEQSAEGKVLKSGGQTFWWRTDRRTDGRTDGRTEGKSMSPFFSSKNGGGQ